MSDSKFKPGMHAAFRQPSRFNCVCGGEVVGGELTTGGWALTHTMPICEDFARLGPIEFLQWLRVEKGMGDA